MRGFIYRWLYMLFGCRQESRISKVEDLDKKVSKLLELLSTEKITEQIRIQLIGKRLVEATRPVGLLYYPEYGTWGTFTSRDIVDETEHEIKIGGRGDRDVNFNVYSGYPAYAIWYNKDQIIWLTPVYSEEYREQRKLVEAKYADRKKAQGVQIL